MCRTTHWGLTQTESKRRPVPGEFFANAPLLNLAPEVLLIELTADYLHAQLCSAALHAFTAENEARMEAMASARNQIERHLSALRRPSGSCGRRRSRRKSSNLQLARRRAGPTTTDQPRGARNDEGRSKHRPIAAAFRGGWAAVDCRAR